MSSSRFIVSNTYDGPGAPTHVAPNYDAPPAFTVEQREVSEERDGRLDIVRVRTEILELAARHNRLLDAGKIDKWAETLTDDASFTIDGELISGRSTLEAWARALPSGLFRVLADPIVNVYAGSAGDPDIAMLKASTIVYATAPLQLHAIGRTSDSFERTKNAWLVSGRHLALHHA